MSRFYQIKWISAVIIGLTLLAGCSDAARRAANSGEKKKNPPTVPETLVTTLSQPLVQEGKIKLLWAEVTNAAQYNLYFAKQTGITPQNYSSLTGGQVRVNVRSGHIETGLENNTYYFFVVTAIDNNSKEHLPSEEVSAQPKIFTIVGELNDTGVVNCTDDIKNTPDCTASSTTHPGQDADYGRDRLANMGTIKKVGGGLAGFDFTKIDQDGFPLENQNVNYAEQPWSCVLDHVTGLLWEVKTNDGKLLDARHTFSWYSEDDANNGTNRGTPNGGVCNSIVCDTRSYQNEINQQGLCGHTSGWRLPMLEELRSLVNYGLKAQPQLDLKYFPNIINPNNAFYNYSYWTAQTRAAIPSNAWHIDFNGGGNSSSGKDKAHHVILVRSMR